MFSNNASTIGQSQLKKGLKAKNATTTLIKDTAVTSEKAARLYSASKVLEDEPGTARSSQKQYKTAYKQYPVVHAYQTARESHCTKKLKSLLVKNELTGGATLSAETTSMFRNQTDQTKSSDHQRGYVQTSQKIQKLQSTSVRVQDQSI